MSAYEQRADDGKNANTHSDSARTDPTRKDPARSGLPYGTIRLCLRHRELLLENGRHVPYPHLAMPS